MSIESSVSLPRCSAATLWPRAPLQAGRRQSNQVSREFVAAHSCDQTRHSSPSRDPPPPRIDEPSEHVSWRSLYIDKAITRAFSSAPLFSGLLRRMGCQRCSSPHSCSPLGGGIREAAHIQPGTHTQCLQFVCFF